VSDINTTSHEITDNRNGPTVPMKLGAIFPSTEIDPTPEAIRRYASGIERVGGEQIVLYDHILGAGLSTRPDFQGPFNSAHVFHEIFTTMAFMSAVTERVTLSTGILVLPQRQTALVAKQAAQVDLLSGGRLRLGVGVGWNRLEYEGQGENFGSRGKRFEDQVPLLRQLWSQPEVTYSSDYHNIDDAGINPLPVQRPIPIWLGTSNPRLLDRVARIADGWMPGSNDVDEVEPEWQELQALRADLHPDDPLGLEGHLKLRDYDESAWVTQAERWREIGASSLCMITTGLGLGSDADAHVERFASVSKLVNRSQTNVTS
jgi:probable F420-dependent oxidoreductase